MKKNYTFFYTLIAAMLVSATSWSQYTITQWNFNGATATSVPGGTSDPAPAIGSGTLQFIGGTTATTPTTDFPSGAASGGSSDPVNTNPNTDFAWGVTTYAASGTENKQRGIQINVATANYTGISLMFDQRLSNTANNTYVVQYTADRFATTPVWVDFQTFTFTPGETDVTGDVWYNQRTVDFSSVPALNNNDMAAFRIMSAFDPATGNYNSATAASTYSATGTTRYDMVTVAASGSLGLPNHNAQANGFRISPNPSNHDIVTFSQPHDVEVYDVTGKVIYKAAAASFFDTRNFASGVYVVKIETGASQKLIVK